MGQEKTLVEHAQDLVSGVFRSAAGSYTVDGIRNNMLLAARMLKDSEYDIESAHAWQAVGLMGASAPDDGLKSLQLSLTRLFAETGNVSDPQTEASRLIQDIKTVNRGASVIVDCNTGKQYIDLDIR